MPPRPDRLLRSGEPMPYPTNSDGIGSKGRGTSWPKYGQGAPETGAAPCGKESTWI